MIWPFIKLTQEYSDEAHNKQERPLELLPEYIEYFSHFEIGFNGSVITVKEDLGEISKILKKKMKEMEKEDM